MARRMASSYSAVVAWRTLPRSRPSIGELLSTTLPLPSHLPQKTPGLTDFRPSFFSSAALEELFLDLDMAVRGRVRAIAKMIITIQPRPLTPTLSPGGGEGGGRPGGGT